MTGEKAVEVAHTVTGRGLIPFTSGIIPFIYAFFWPVSFGHWLGQIVGAFRTAAGFDHERGRFVLGALRA